MNQPEPYLHLFQPLVEHGVSYLLNWNVLKYFMPNFLPLKRHNEINIFGHCTCKYFITIKLKVLFDLFMSSKMIKVAKFAVQFKKNHDFSHFTKIADIILPI